MPDTIAPEHPRPLCATRRSPAMRLATATACEEASDARQFSIDMSADVCVALAKINVVTPADDELAQAEARRAAAVDDFRHDLFDVLPPTARAGWTFDFDDGFDADHLVASLPWCGGTIYVRLIARARTPERWEIETLKGGRILLSRSALDAAGLDEARRKSLTLLMCH